MDKLEELRRKIDEAIARKQFGDAFQVALKQLIELVKGTQQALTEGQKKEFERIETALETVLSSFRAETQSGLSEASKKQEEKINTALFTIESLVSEAQAKIDEVRDGEDGEDADEELIVDRVLAQIPDPVEQTAEGTRDLLETLILKEEEEKLDPRCLKDWEKLLKRIKELESRPQGGVTGVVGKDFINAIDISSQLDGVTTTFNTQAMYRVLSISLSSYPYGTLRYGIDFTWTPTSVTFLGTIDPATQLSAGQQAIILAIT